MPETLTLPETSTRAEVVALAPDFSHTRPRAPLVTIGIPAYNRPGLLAEALASIAAQRGFDDFEVVVCDDGGLAETRQAVERSGLPNIRFYANRTRLGAVGNWNRCVQLATGRWVTVLHEDDLVYPWFLSTVASHLRTGVAAVAVRCSQGEHPLAIAPAARVGLSRAYQPVWFLKSSMTPFPGVVFPRELALQLGGFDSREGAIADYAFWYALARAGRIDVLPETAAFYRIRSGQWTEREWPAMLRRSHLLRLRVAREQLAQTPRLGRWLARFYTGRMARAYARRFTENPATLQRATRFRRAAFAWLPSGWVWRFLQLAAPFTSGTR